MKIVVSIFSLLVSFSMFNSRAQDNGRVEKLYFIQPGFMLGKNVPSYSSFPKANLRTCIVVDAGVRYIDTLKSRAIFYKSPQYGISFSYSKLGNDTSFGEEISIMPFFVFNPFKHFMRGLKFRIGLGFSYFTQMYDSITNIPNKAIGSSFNWSFQGAIYKDIFLSSRTRLNIGATYLHSSNGHTQLPNFGLNAAMLTISYQFFMNKIMPVPREITKPAEIPKSKNFFLLIRQGNGIHELGGTTGPVGGKKRFVYSISLAGGILFNQHVKVRTGFTYRYYEQFNYYAQEREIPDFSGSPAWFASNIYFFAGCEFLVGHFGLDLEGGLNLFKPFYKEFFETFEFGSNLSYTLKKFFPSRLGLNYYIFNTENNPRNNVSIGAHINANFGEADFSELSIAYTKLLK